MPKIIAAGLILSLSLALTDAAYCQDTPTKNVLTIARVCETTTLEHIQLAPIITYLASRLKDAGIEQGKVVPVRNNEDVIKYLKDGSLDIVIESVFSAHLYRHKANAVPVLLAWRHGVRDVSSFIFVRRDSGINLLEDLKGKVIAFEDPGGTDEYFLPKYSLQADGFDLVEISSADAPVPEGKIGYVFAGAELNISAWVFFKKVDAGAMSNALWTSESDVPDNYRKEFKIIYETSKVPKEFVVVREGLDENLAARIKEELLKMDETEEGREALKGGLDIHKFTEMPEGICESVENIIIKAGAKELY